MNIKQIPEDFIVTENSNVPCNGGRYKIFSLRKKNISETQALALISNRLKIKERFIGIAGNKDKHAVTEQLISIGIDCNEQELNQIDPRMIFNYKGSSNDPISLGGLDGNDFRIIVRNLSGKEEIRTINFIPNYFDEQRFSSNNVTIGRAIIKRDFKTAVQTILDSNKNDDVAISFVKQHLSRFNNDHIGALRKIPLRTLLIYVHSYQSYLFNLMLSDHIKRYNNFEIDYSLGKLHIPLEELPSIDIPLIGFGTDPIQVSSIMNSEGIKTRDFILREIPELSSEGALRPALIEIKNLEISDFEDDELNQGMKKLKFSFFLGKGSYATMAIKTIIRTS